MEIWVVPDNWKNDGLTKRMERNGSKLFKQGQESGEDVQHVLNIIAPSSWPEMATKREKAPSFLRLYMLVKLIKTYKLI